MKNIALILLLIPALHFSNQSNAQVRVNVNINVGDQPSWGPQGYDEADYYYLPDIEVYYYVPRRQFIYFDDGRWVYSPYLPERCHSYDLYRGYKVVINDPRPYLHHDVYRDRYSRYRNCYDRQPVLREYRDRDYDDGPGHGRGRGHAYGHYKEHGHGHDQDED